MRFWGSAAKIFSMRPTWAHDNGKRQEADGTNSPLSLSPLFLSLPYSASDLPNHVQPSPGALLAHIRAYVAGTGDVALTWTNQVQINDKVVDLTKQVRTKCHEHVGALVCRELAHTCTIAVRCANARQGLPGGFACLAHNGMWVLVYDARPFATTTPTMQACWKAKADHAREAAAKKGPVAFTVPALDITPYLIGMHTPPLPIYHHPTLTLIPRLGSWYTFQIPDRLRITGYPGV